MEEKQRQDLSVILLLLPVWLPIVITFLAALFTSNQTKWVTTFNEHGQPARVVYSQNRPTCWPDREGTEAIFLVCQIEVGYEEVDGDFIEFDGLYSTQMEKVRSVREDHRFGSSNDGPYMKGD